MEVEYTRDEMRQLWKRLRWLEPLRSDATVVRSDGTDLDALAESEMRLWYLSLLHEAPLEMLALTELASQASVRRLRGDGTQGWFPAGAALLEVTVPRGVIRLARFVMQGQAMGPDIVEDPSDPRWRLGLNRFRRGMAPAAALWLRSSSVILLPAPADGSLPAVASLHAVADTGPEIYRFQEQALATIGGRGE